MSVFMRANLSMSQPHLAESVTPIEWQFTGFDLPAPDSAEVNRDHFRFRSD